MMLKSVCIFPPSDGTSVILVLLLLVMNCPAVLSNRALIIVDVQNCFTGNGSLSVKGGEEIIPVINTIRQNYEQHFSVVALTQDWHCVDHVSFASSHINRTVFETINLTYLSTGELCESEVTRASYTVNCTALNNKTLIIEQKLWPDHCIQYTAGANFHERLKIKTEDLVIRKGQHCQIDSYSGFFDNGHFSHTDLHKKLTERNIKEVFLTGLVMDICVYDTAKDARRLGYDTYIITDATGRINNSTAEAARKEMTSLGVVFIDSSDLGTILTSAANGKLEPQFAALVFLVLAINRLWN